jgi:hypothetical protein
MTPLNTLPIEDFLNKVRVAGKSKQQTVTLTIQEAQSLEDSLAVVMTRLAGELDKVISIASSAEPSSIKMDGGGF